MDRWRNNVETMTKLKDPTGERLNLIQDSSMLVLHSLRCFRQQCIRYRILDYTTLTSSRFLFEYDFQDLRRDLEAEKVLRSSITSVPTHVSAATALGFLLLRRGSESSMSEAQDLMAKALGFAPSASAWLNLGAVQKQRGRLDDAVQHTLTAFFFLLLCHTAA